MGFTTHVRPSRCVAHDWHHQASWTGRACRQTRQTSRQWWSQLAPKSRKTRDGRHYDCPRRAPAALGTRLEAGNRRWHFGSKPSSASRTAPETKYGSWPSRSNGWPLILAITGTHFRQRRNEERKGGSDSRVQREQQARGGLIKRFFSKQEWNLVQRIGSEQVEHGRPLERFQASSAHDAARGAAARCFKGW
jgi:hypothetical protein